MVLRLDGLARRPMVQSVSLELHAGEVLGLGGLVGAGRSDLARLIFGADRPDAGSMALEGRPYAPRTPAAALRAGVGLVPEERRADGLLLTKSVAFNLALANLGKVVFSPALPLVSGRKLRSLAEDTIRALAVKAEGPGQPVGRLSGGNQQKVVIGRWLARRPKVLILDEPTRGVDVGARAEIHRLIRQLAAEGMAVLVDLVGAGRVAGPLRPGAGDGRGADRSGAEGGGGDAEQRRCRELCGRKGGGAGMSLAETTRAAFARGPGRCSGISRALRRSSGWSR